MEALELSAQARAVCVYRDDDFILPQTGRDRREVNEVVLVSHRRHLAGLDECFGKAPAKAREEKAEAGQ